jgi:Flp pilus assembly protein TadG
MTSHIRVAVQEQTNRQRRKRRSRRGSAVVELAFTAPVLFLIVFGMIDVGRAVMVQNLITNAARDGARAAALDGATAETIQQNVVDYLAASSVPGASATVSPNPLTNASWGDPVSCTVQIPFNSVSWLPQSWYFNGANFQATVVMRREATN